MKSRQTKAAFLWIVSILQKHQVPFQVTGGLAAKFHGSVRVLADIDIDIPRKSFPVIASEVSKFVIFGPAKYKDRNWDLFLMTLRYRGQEIDLGSAKARIYSKRLKRWIGLRANFKKSERRVAFGLEVPVIKRELLLRYKRILSRRVDMTDISMIIDNERKFP